MMRTLFFVSLSLALTTGIAQADVITTYTLSNVVTANRATVTGSFMIDQTTYNQLTDAGFVGGSLTVSDEPAVDSDLDGTYSFFGYTDNTADFSNSAFSELFITIGNPPFTSGSEVVTLDLAHGSNVDVDLSAMSGTITATTTGLSSVPEPSSLALLAGGVGLLGLVSTGVFRRRTIGDCRG